MTALQIEMPEVMRAIKKLEDKLDAMAQPIPLDYLTVDQYAKINGISDQTVRARIKSGSIKVKGGVRPYRILIEQL